MKQDYYRLNVRDVLSILNSTGNGLSSEEARSRLEADGPNTIAEGKPTPIWVLILHQFKNPMVYILLAAALITVLTGHSMDAVIISIVLFFNASIGLYYEVKAERAINAIKAMSSPKCRVRRNGSLSEIEASQLVRGDVVDIEEGDQIAADGRLLEAARLTVDEASLTGESLPVSKNCDALDEDVPMVDRHNIVYMGTFVVGGRGSFVVTETGMKTELGNIATLIHGAETIETPLQERLSRLVIHLGWFVAAACLTVFLLGMFWGIPWDENLLTAISLAVSAIPEGLPVVTSIVLAVGVRRMAGRNAIMRKLSAVETLGSTNVICTDKTGTLTMNQMTVSRIWSISGEANVTGLGYTPHGEIEKSDPLWIKPLLEASVLCNNADLSMKKGHWTMTGDGTEGALLVAAAKYDPALLNMPGRKSRVDEIPFDSSVKRMVTIHPFEGSYRASMKGSPEAVLDTCTEIMDNGNVRPITESDREIILKANDNYARQALRVLAVAVQDLSRDMSPSRFVNSRCTGYCFLGLAAMMDMPRPEVTSALAACHQAGIRVIMITGDHPVTASAVARMVGLKNESVKTMTGTELDKIDDQQLEQKCMDIDVYARVTPEHKMRIVEALRTTGNVTAMTGDGVNDAPALSRADIGIAMGITGTQVAREASDMVLADDNFASIVSAVEEGRVIYSNLRKVILFLLSTNAGEVFTLLTSSIAGMLTPLLAVHILFINLVTDTFSTIALGLEKPEGNEMTAPPRDKEESLFSRAMKIQISVTTILMAAGTILLFRWSLSKAEMADFGDPVSYARTMAFTVMVFFQLWNVFNCRSFKTPLKKLGVFSNPYVGGAIIAGSLLQLIAVYSTDMNRFLNTVPLAVSDLMICVLLPGITFLTIEALKLIRNE